METLHLIPHPAYPPARVRSVTARVQSHDAHWCVVRWKVDGARDVMVPAFAGRARADELWRTTCCELFVAGNAATGYSEFNFSPSERWAAYDFAAYRTGMAERAVARAPVITPRRGADVLFCDVAIPTAALPPLPWRYGLSAVIAESGGVTSYWALAHPRDRPDFHDPACFGAWLAAPAAA